MQCQTLLTFYIKIGLPLEFLVNLVIVKIVFYIFLIFGICFGRIKIVDLYRIVMLSLTGISRTDHRISNPILFDNAICSPTHNNFCLSSHVTVSEFGLE